MDSVFLSRIQFSLCVGFHYIFPLVTIGLSWFIFFYQSLYIYTGKKKYQLISFYWIKIFTISFVVGVATGIIMEFQFGTNWANYSKQVGDVFGAPLAAEIIFAFFLESVFLSILVYGKNKFYDKTYWFASLMVALGTTLSVFWIIVANSWQQTPAGYRILDGKFELLNFSEAVFNPSTIPRFFHVFFGSFLTSSFLVMAISAYYLLKNQHTYFSKLNLKNSLISAVFFALLMGATGHYHAVQVANSQPAKLAAFEGLWETQSNASLLLFGIPNEEKEVTEFSLRLPGVLSILVGGSPKTEVKGLKDFPKEDRPPVLFTFFTFHLMVGLGFFFIFLTLLGIFLWKKNKLFTHKLFLLSIIFSFPLTIIANELGWISAEVGRQPWIVYGLLRTSDGVSTNLSSSFVLVSILIYSFIYLFLFFMWSFFMGQQIIAGPSEEIENLKYK